MFNFKELEERYRKDAPFNKIVNLHVQLLKEFGFLPSEIREAAFLAQYLFEVGRVETILKTQDEWNKIEVARKVMQQAVVNIEDLLNEEPRRPT